MSHWPASLNIFYIGLWYDPIVRIAPLRLLDYLRLLVHYYCREQGQIVLLICKSDIIQQASTILAL